MNEKKWMNRIQYYLVAHWLFIDLKITDDLEWYWIAILHLWRWSLCQFVRTNRIVFIVSHTLLSLYYQVKLTRFIGHRLTATTSATITQKNINCLQLTAYSNWLRSRAVLIAIADVSRSSFSLTQIDLCTIKFTYWRLRAPVVVSRHSWDANGSFYVSSTVLPATHKSLDHQQATATGCYWCLHRRARCGCWSCWMLLYWHCAFVSNRRNSIKFVRLAS